MQRATDRVRLPSAPPTLGDAADLRDFLDRHERLMVLTGAGCSTESGIPDYRADDGTVKRRAPIEYDAFVGDATMRARYWARSLLGWRTVDTAAPNAAHRALADLERRGRVTLLATQNVDGLHQAAGSRCVVDLHGRIHRVVCLACRHGFRRQAWQDHLGSLNLGWVGLDAPAAPDGDADLDGVDFTGFVVPACPRCGGLVKPDVVFFGERVPPWRHTQAMAALHGSDALLVVGSSLMVASGYRYVRAADRAGIPVAMVNRGRTRADDLVSLKVVGSAGDILTAATA
jgi:NAD-dependent SIR2 family protein deacetylase